MPPVPVNYFGAAMRCVWSGHKGHRPPLSVWFFSALHHPNAAATLSHRAHRISWLRAAVLGANDGIVSTASLIVGVAAAVASRNGILVAGLAGLLEGTTTPSSL